MSLSTRNPRRPSHPRNDCGTDTPTGLWGWVRKRINPRCSTTTRTTVTAAAIALGVGSCVAHTSYQSARVVEAGKEHVTFAGGRTTIHEDGERGTEWWSGEFMTRHNLSPAVDMGFKLAVAGADGGGTFSTSLDVKRALVKHRLAASLGLGMVLPAPESVHVFPGLIATQPLTRFVDVNAAAKLVFVPGAPSPQPMVAYNFGLAFRMGNSGFELRPEIAVLDLRDGNANWIQFGVGVALPYVQKRDVR